MEHNKQMILRNEKRQMEMYLFQKKILKNLKEADGTGLNIMNYSLLYIHHIFSL